jgi:hypothetical protein
MNENVIFPIGNIVMLDIIKKDYGYFDFILVAALNNLTTFFSTSLYCFNTFYRYAYPRYAFSTIAFSG